MNYRMSIVRKLFLCVLFMYDLNRLNKRFKFEIVLVG